MPPGAALCLSARRAPSAKSPRSLKIFEPDQKIHRGIEIARKRDERAHFGLDGAAHRHQQAGHPHGGRQEVFSHSEVPIDKVKTISGSCKRANNTVLLVLGILFILCLVTAIIGIILLVLWSKAPSTVELSLDLEGAASDGIQTQRRADNYKKRARKTKIRVNYPVVKQMLAELGTVVRTQQALNARNA